MWQLVFGFAPPPEPLPSPLSENYFELRWRQFFHIEEDDYEAQEEYHRDDVLDWYQPSPSPRLDEWNEFQNSLEYYVSYGEHDIEYYLGQNIWEWYEYCHEKGGRVFWERYPSTPLYCEF